MSQKPRIQIPYRTIDRAEEFCAKASTSLAVNHETSLGTVCFNTNVATANPSAFLLVCPVVSA